MTAQGSPISVLRRAIRGGSLGAVDMALFEIPHLDLEDALGVVLLLAEADDERYAAWSQRWIERAAAHERDRVRSLFDRLPDPAAVEALQAAAKTHRNR